MAARHSETEHLHQALPGAEIIMFVFRGVEFQKQK
jgi:hypothetical protein